MFFLYKCCDLRWVSVSWGCLCVGGEEGTGGGRVVRWGGMCVKLGKKEDVGSFGEEGERKERMKMGEFFSVV